MVMQWVNDKYFVWNRKYLQYMYIIALFCSESSPLSCHTEVCFAVIELRPVSTDAWCYVQGIAQNPRLQ